MTSASLSKMTPRLVQNVKNLIALFEAKRNGAAGRPWDMGADFFSPADACHRMPAS